MTEPRASRHAARLLLAVALLGGCAWTEPANRRTWNLFEQHVVPEEDPAYSLTLPLTALGGLVAIVLDSVVVHPVAVLDDAALHTVDTLWGDIDWDASYYTECALAPARAVWTVVFGVFNWAGRALFAVPPYPPPDAAEQKAAAERGRRTAQAAFRAALEALDGGGSPTLRVPVPQTPWEPDLVDVVRRALALDDPHVRATLFTALRETRVPGLVAPWDGLDDPDPRVRLALLLAPGLPRNELRALLDDPDGQVAFVARRLWQGPLR